MVRKEPKRKLGEDGGTTLTNNRKSNRDKFKVLYLGSKTFSLSGIYLNQTMFVKTLTNFVFWKLNFLKHFLNAKYKIL